MFFKSSKVFKGQKIFRDQIKFLSKSFSVKKNSITRSFIYFVSCVLGSCVWCVWAGDGKKFVPAVSQKL